jgi:hypothetical protein
MLGVFEVLGVFDVLGVIEVLGVIVLGVIDGGTTLVADEAAWPPFISTTAPPRMTTPATSPAGISQRRPPSLPPPSLPPPAFVGAPVAWVSLSQEGSGAGDHG